MHLQDIQRELEQLYDVTTEIELEDYLITDRVLAGALYGAELTTQEALLVQQSHDEIAISLYLDSELITRVQALSPEHPWTATSLNDFWLVLEGISHLLCVAWRARSDRTTSALELELQAEVDKFVLTAATLYRHHGPTPSEHLRHVLFGRAHFLPELTRPLQQRYRRASRLAAAFCNSLSQRFAMHDGERGLSQELRRFYRFDWSRKVAYIGALNS